MVNPHHMSSISRGQAGYIYIMGTSAHSYLKIGQTTLDPATRAKQLSAATASPTPFTVLYSRAVTDCNEAEAKMHVAFADRRVNDGREFFSVSLYEAAIMLDRICGSSQFKPKPLTPFSELFASFPDDGGDRALTPEEQTRCRELESASSPRSFSPQA